MIGARYVDPVRTASWCLALVLIAAGSACGRSSSVGAGSQTASTTPSSSPSSSPSASKASPSIPSGWKTYSDQTYGFSISYPDTFTFKQEGGAFPARGWLIEYRAVDTRYLGTYPSGQVEMGVYTKDANTLTAWVQKHSDATCGMPNSTAFFWNVSNLKTTTAAGRDAVSFDDNSKGCEGPQSTNHFTVFFLGSNHVFRFNWWASDANYSPTIEAIADKMLASFTAP
jgi:hypothetical protein